MRVEASDNVTVYKNNFNNDDDDDQKTCSVGTYFTIL